MFQRIAVLFCLLFLCMGLTVQAETHFGDENTAASGRTEVTARVELSETAPEEEQPSDPDHGMPSGNNVQTDNHRYQVKTGDTNEPATMLFLLLISSIVLVAERIRN